MSSTTKNFVTDVFGSTKAMLNTPLKIITSSCSDEKYLTLSLDNHSVSVGAILNESMSSEDNHSIARQMAELWNERNTWLCVSDVLPECPHEHNEEHDENGYPQWEGCVSNSLEISDGHNLARGHYRDDGVWVIYAAEHDFQIVNPEEVTHWKPLPKPPYLEN